MGGTAASAGLVTRGICGVATPDANTGACSKENLYINYDGDNSYRSGRQVVLQAGTTGEHYGHNLYQYAAARGDAVKGYVDSKIPTALKNPNALTFGSKTYDGSSAQTLTLSDLGGQAAGNYVTTDTAQTISGFKTFSAPANVAGQESATVKIKTSNGGAIIFGKEGPNSGSMIRLDQTDGTTRLQFRASATPGAMVWKQPESGAALFFDFGPNAARTTMPTSGGTLAYTSQIPSVGNGTLTIQKNGTEVAKFTANSSSNVTANISVPTITKQATTGISASFAGTGHTHSAPTITVNSSNTATNGASNSVNVYSSITGLTAAITTSYNSANKKLTIGINSYPSSFGTTAVATSAHTHTYSKVTGATASAIAASTAGGTITITDSGHTHNI